MIAFRHTRFYLMDKIARSMFTEKFMIFIFLSL